MALKPERIERLAAIAIVGVIALGCLTVLRPFLPALTWALILSMSTWPTYRWLETKLNGRRTLAAAIMTFLVAVALLLPLVLVGTQLAEQVTSFSRLGISTDPCRSTGSKSLNSIVCCHSLG